jgi:RHS repeat-associated protein
MTVSATTAFGEVSRIPSYYRARYYTSSMGRFMSPDWTETPDPIPYADQKDPQTLNLYTYGLNNPPRSIDSDGHIPVTFCSKDKTTSTQDAQGNIHVTVTAGQCTTLDDGRITPGDNGLGLIAGWGLGKVISPIIGAGVGWVADLFDSDAINITEEGMEYVLERHAADGVKSAGKSLFKGSKGEIKSLIKKAASTTPTKQANGNLARVVNAGRTVGVDRATGAPTSTYTVITKASGDLVTAFPGRP